MGSSEEGLLLASRKFNAPGFGDHKGDLAPASLNLNSVEHSQGAQTPGDLSLTSSQFPRSPDRRRSSILSKASRTSAAGSRLPLKSHKPARGGEHKERYFKDRTPITKELAKLKSAEDATWAPYAMLRPALPETALFSYVKPKKRRDDAAAADAVSQQGDEGSAAPAASSLPKSDFGASKAAPASLLSSSSALLSPAAASPANASPSKQGSFRLVDGKLVRSTAVEEAPQAEPWDMDPAVNREGKFDLTLDDPKYIASPTWARCASLRHLGILADPGDEEVITAALRCLGDTEGVVRVAALELLKALSEKGDKKVIKPVLQLTRDRDPNVRGAVCSTLQALTHPGVPASRQHPATGTSLDVTLMQRDKTVIDALQPLLDDPLGHALDKINAGWQTFKKTEERWDDSRRSPRPRRPLQSEKVVSSKQPIERLWDRTYTYDDLLPDVGQKGNAGPGAVEVSGRTRGHDARHLTLAGFKYRSYNDALRQQRMVDRFEQEQQKAASKVQLERKLRPETQGRKLTTEWMGIEWVDRSKRAYLGKTLHAFGAGIEPGRDSVAAPYNEGYNGFAVPLGYSYI